MENTQQVTYEQDADGTYVAVVPDGIERRKGYEVAAWYQRVTLQGGRYPMKRFGSSFLVASVPATIVETFTPSLFCGNMIGGTPQRDDSGEPTTYGIQVYDYEVRDAVLGHTWKGDDGRFCGCSGHLDSSWGLALYEGRFERREREVSR